MGVTALQGLYPSVTETELVPFVILDVGAADGLAIRKSNVRVTLLFLLKCKVQSMSQRSIRRKITSNADGFTEKVYCYEQ